MKMTRKQILFLCILGLSIMLLAACGGVSSFVTAEMKLQKNNYQDAIPAYQDFIARHPTSTIAHNKLGFCYLKTGRTQDSIKEFEKVLHAEPDNAYAILYAGIAYLKTGRYEDTLTVWQGYRNGDKPLVEQEIRRLLTLVQIKESRRAAKKALAMEKKLRTVAPGADTVTVCYYRDLSPKKNLRAFQKGLAAMVMTDLSKIKSIKVVERLRLEALLKEMQFARTGAVSTKTAPRIGHLLGAEHMMVGSLALGSIQATTSLVSARTGKLKGSATHRVAQEMFYDLPIMIVRDFARIRGITLTAEERNAIGTPHTKNYQAFLYYGRALDALDNGEWFEAKSLFRKALKKDPAFDLAKRGLEATPGSDSPDISSVQGMTAHDLADFAETAVGNVESAQADADSQAEAASGGGGGGGPH